MSDTPAGDREDEARVLVLNPNSGSADHGPEVRNRAADHGFDVRVSEEPGDAVDLAAEAAKGGADVVAAAGGDGTLNEVVCGIDRADAFEDVTFCPVPCGTGNNFASNVGVGSIAAAFDAVETGEERAIDLGRANDEPFINSCVGGLTADASASTSADLKERIGVAAYAVSTLRTMAEFDGVPIHVETSDDIADPWSGEALIVMIGNCRRPPDESGRTQANVEDGLFEVTILEEEPAIDLVEDAIEQRLFGSEAVDVVTRRTPELRITTDADDPVNYSLDGEMISAESLHAATEHRRLKLRVGDAYAPDPD
ncbi:YegS/Rv2252/BmrU family lipid kinase [Halostella sp. JP-L12]|uniref:diacylglycerol/lipid kinase family protein n=1 Tax=Halostella TaxID=1843185 RepID=UPI000EF7914D|nr:MULTISPECIES: YegS/Rv2252/BmrU family lipid kinase [Halostella]NHN47058.1 YegS/Rv2252/BmrU family lipid kinase [Halostella sp. JP-L12]